MLKDGACGNCGCDSFDVKESTWYEGVFVNGAIRYDASDPGGDVEAEARCSGCNAPVEGAIPVLAR